MLGSEWPPHFYEIACSLNLPENTDDWSWSGLLEFLLSWRDEIDFRILPWPFPLLSIFDVQSLVDLPPNYKFLGRNLPPGDLLCEKVKGKLDLSLANDFLFYGCLNPKVFVVKLDLAGVFFDLDP